MNTMVQTQQAAIQAAPGRVTSKCTPHLKGWNYHIHYADFEAINDGYAPDADALRGFETMTDLRIEELRMWQQLPADALPAEEELWFEVSGYGLEKWTLKVYRHATYDYSIARLVGRGFLRRRFVARMGYSTELPHIVVDDEDGNYHDSQGIQHNAMSEGYRVIRRQYLYCIKAVNAALAKLAGQSPPVPLQRIKKRAASVPATTKSGTGSATTNDHGFATVVVAPQGGTKSTKSFTVEDNTPDSVDATSLRSAPWCAVTIIGLAAQIAAQLFVAPDESALDDAQALLDLTADMDPTRAWERIELHAWAMGSGPTWYARGRTRKTPFSLRNIVTNWQTVEAELRKEPWAAPSHIEYFGPPLFDDAAPGSYAAGYGGTAQPAHNTAHALEVVVRGEHIDARTTKPLRAEDAPTIVVESTAQIVESDAQQASGNDVQVSDNVTQGCARPSVESLRIDEQAAQGMDGRSAEMAIQRIQRDYPNAVIGLLETSPGLFIVGVQYALDAWLDFVALREVRLLTEETAQLLAQAEEYGARQHLAANSNDSQGPPGGEAMEGEER